MQLFIGNIFSNFAELSEEESRHFSKVLRGKLGDTLFVSDGNGSIIQGIVCELNSKKVIVKIKEVIPDLQKRDYSLHIAIAPTKSMDRLEFFLEKATEIGIDQITFLRTFHSERKNINLERCQKILQSAAKQSVKASIPKLKDLIKFSDFITSDFSSQKLIAHCNSDFERIYLKDEIKPKENYLILIGPEGDFSKEEIELAEKNNFKGISLGTQRFRTETAALNAVFGLNWMNF